MALKDHMINSAMRLFFLVAGTVIWLGIWLTGFNIAHWILYIPAVFFLFAALTGICPGIIFTKMIVPDNKKTEQSSG